MTHSLLPAEATGTDSPLRVGVVGLGRSGYGIHLNLFRHRPNRFTVVAVADTNKERATQTAADFPCPAYASIEELLADTNVELVVVASPNRFHAPHVVAALNAGKHVVCEKPFGLTVADVDAMIAARDAAIHAVGSPIVLAPFQNRRFEAAFQKVREILTGGKLGRIVHVRMAYHQFGRRWDWQTLQHTGGGQLNNNGPHPIDQALVFLADQGVTNPDDIEVWADLRNTLSSGDAEDHVRLTLRVPARPDVPTIDIEFFATCAYPQDTWLVLGTSGSLKGSNQSLSLRYVDWSQEPPRPVTEESTPDRSYNHEKLTWQEETIPVGDTGGGPGAPPAAGLAEQFYNGVFAAIRHGAPLLIAPEEARRRIAIIEKARAAAPNQ